MEYSIFGCRVNKYYLNKRLGYFIHQKKDDDAYLVATCEVTDRAKQKWLKKVKQKAIQGSQIYITGCGVLKKGILLSEKEFYSIYPELLLYKENITLLGEEPDKGLRIEDGELRISTKKYIVIQNGCDNFCTFCLTIQKRGKHISRGMEEIVEEVRNAERLGCKEIVLTGINLAARGASNTTKADESRFAFLLREILRQTTIPRVRISSLGPEYLDDEFFEVIKNPRILPHFHLSIQSFSDNVLHTMKRNYTAETLDKVLTKLRALQLDVPVSLGADIIVGFPGETEEDFQETVDGVKKFGINKVHAFPFSDHHTGTTIPASSLTNQVDPMTKRRRDKELKKTADIIAEQFYQENKGISHSVLVEGNQSGWTENYIKVDVGPEHKKGEIIQVVL